MSETTIKTRGLRKERRGRVVSDKMDKTVVVQVERTFAHRLYKKYIRRRKNYMVHDETNDCREGDTVVITETKPRSKNKHWKITKVIARAK